MDHLSPRAAALAAALGLLTAIAPASADPPTSALSWTRLDGAETCIGPRELAQAVEARLRREVFVSPARSRLLIEGQIAPAPAPDRFRAVLKLSDDKGTTLGARDLRTQEASCRALDKQLAFVVAVLIDPDAALAPEPAEKPPTPPPPPRPPPSSASPPPTILQRTPVAPPARITPRPPPAPWYAGVTGGLAFAFGLLPDLGVGAEIRGHITPPRWPTFEFGGTTWAAASAKDAARGVKLTLADAFLSLCPLTTAAARIRLSGCAGARLGVLHTASLGLDHTSDDEHIVFSATAGGRIDVHIAGPLQASLGLGLLVPVTRYRFAYRVAGSGESELFHMWPIVASVDAGLGVEFP